MWQGHLTLKNDLTAVQLHFLSGNAELAKMSLPPGSDKLTPTLHIAQRMRLEKSQLDGVERRIQVSTWYRGKNITIIQYILPRMRQIIAYSWLYHVERVRMMFLFKLKSSKMVLYRTCFRNRLLGLLIYKHLRSDDHKYKKLQE